MRNRNRGLIAAALICVTAIAFAALFPACNRQPEPEPTPEPTVDPYAGLIQVSDGMGGLMWVPDHDNVSAFNIDMSLFYQDGEFISYSGDDRKVRRGIDVSFYQKTIDWAAVKSDGIEFAIVRVGYRGFSEGIIYEDEEFRNNIEGALSAGLEVGVYFFSQAISTEEALEEAQFAISCISEYDITLPVVFDWEFIGEGYTARTDDITGEVLTDCAITFCNEIRNAGFKPAIYFYRTLGYFYYDLEKLAGIPFWVGAPGDIPDFYYDHYMWQYSFTGKVDGIDADVDLNLMFG